MSEPGAIGVPRRAALRTVLTAAWQADRRRSVLAVVLFGADALLGAMLGVWLKLLLDGAGQGSAVLLGWGAGALAATVAGRFALEHLGGRVRQALNEQAHHLMERRLLAAVGRTPTLELHETPEHLTQLELLDAEGWEFGAVVPSLISVFATAVQMCSAAVLLASVDPLLLLLPLFGLPALLLSGRTGNLFARGNELAAEPTRLAGELYELALAPGAAQELRLFRLRGELRRRFAAAHRERRRLVMRCQVPGQLLGLAARLAFAAGYFGAILYVAARAVDGAVGAGDVVLTAVLAGQVLGLVSGSAAVLQFALQTLNTAARAVYVARVAEASRAGVREDGAAPSRLRDGIRLEGVRHRYPGASRPALDGIDLHLPAGATVALVGENGSGKSTLVKLLAGLHRPGAGRILLDGAELGRLPPERWRARVSAAFQDHARFEFPLREAVGIGDLAGAGPAGAGAALERAGAGDLAAGLPDGLDTVLGPQWPGGVDLSGGQWQKVALGRAMMRRDPLLLLLDEPTAALDAETEQALFDRWTRASREVRAVAVLVSHRFSTVRFADVIVVLAGGRVAERGTHDELIAAGGLYAELYGMQARGYGR